MICDQLFELDPSMKLCPRCNAPLVVEYEYGRMLYTEVLSKAYMRRELGVWSFYPLLPTRSRGISLGEGWTPLLEVEKLAKSIEMKKVWIKNESVNPSNTFIDRGVAVDLWFANEYGYKRIVAPTLGDFGISISCYAAKLGIDAHVYAPKDIEKGKLYRMILGGSKVILVDSYSKALEKALRIASLHNFYLSIPASPTVIDGYRTIVFEVARFIKDLDVVIVPVGDGVLATAIYKGFKELAERLEIEPPRIVAVQSLSRPSIVSALYGYNVVSDGRVDELLLREVLVDRPLAMATAIKAIKESDGTAIAVSDSEALDAVLKLARHEGISVDPIGALGIAALIKAVSNGIIARDEKVLVILSGSPSRDPFILYRVLEKDLELMHRVRSLEKDEELSISKMKLEILKIIAEHRAMHVYGIWKELRYRGYTLALSTVHHHVKELEQYGLVKAISRDNRKTLYALTPIGIEILEKFRG